MPNEAIRSWHYEAPRKGGIVTFIIKAKMKKNPELILKQLKRSKKRKLYIGS